MWSKKFKYCIKCGSTNNKYIARGLCEKCYYKDIENRHKPDKRIKGLASKSLRKENLIKLYSEQELSMGDIAKLYNCSRQYINKKLKEYNIPSRTKSNARKLALQNEKISFTKVENGKKSKITLQYNFIDEDFFSIWSPQMAYVLGIIATDGCLTKYSAPHAIKKYKRLSVDQKEPELLEKVLKLLKSNIKIYRHRNNKHDFISTIQITNEKIVRDVIKLGITERKSNTLLFPNIPKEYIRHFIRGCWDGDGSIFINGNQYRANFVSGSFRFISKMINILREVGFHNIKINKQKKGDNSYYYFYINGDYLCTKLYYYLYYNVTPDQYLERKYNLFKDGVLRNEKRENHKNFLKTLKK